jgi:hypothetical protein
MDTNNFLHQFHRDEKINFRVIKNNFSINLYGTYSEKQNELRKYNEQGYNVYFAVNSGGTHNVDIKKINAVFIDFDCGKDENNNYFPLTYTKEFKKQCVEKVKNFKFTPSIIVETRNGIHSYWLINEGTPEEYLKCQLGLIQYFKSDESIKDLARIMRLPGYYWTKDINNKFMCSIIEHNNYKYSIKEIINELTINNIIVEGVLVLTIPNTKELLYSKEKNPSEDTENIRAIKKRDVNYLRNVIQPQHMVFSTYNDIYNYLKKQDLTEFLDLPLRFNCIFHEDNNPSANIYIDNETEYWWYKCFSPKCGKVRDIISIVEYYQKCTTPQALKFLKDVYDIEYIESDWQRTQKAILEENKRLLRDTERFKLIAPETYNRIKNHIQDLYIINDIAKDYIFDKKYSTNDDKALFWSSLKKIANLCNKKTKQSIGDYIGLFTYLGLLEKLYEENIPKEIYDVAKEYANIVKNKIIENVKNKGNYTDDEINKIEEELKIPTVNFYNVPSYSENTLTFSEQKSLEFKEKGFTMRGWSREMILRSLGEDEANRVFPQMKGTEISQLNDNTTYEIEQVLLKLIEENGYTTEKEVIDNSHLNFKNKYIEKEYKQTQFKKAIPEIIDKYDLKRVRVDKLLKEKYKIKGNGYPFIIIKNNK